MNELGTLPPATTRPRGRARTVGRAVAALAMGALLPLAVAALLFQDPTYAPRVSIDNPSEYDILIGLREAGSASRLPLGVAVQQCVTSFEAVLDQGSTWVVDFESQGRSGGQISVDRDQLERDNWTLHVPQSAIDALRANGAPDPPARGCATR